MKFKKEDLFLAIDTETTGFVKKGQRKQDNQARVCQVALLLFDGTGKSIMEVSTMVKPSEWIIGEGAKAVHGFSNEDCEAFGINQSTMICLYRFMAKKANYIIAHNSEFDKAMMEIEEFYFDEAPNLTGIEWLCTMKPNSHITGGKYPKLNEALKHFCNRDMGDTAHNAMYDVQACRDIFLASNIFE